MTLHLSTFVPPRPLESARRMGLLDDIDLVESRTTGSSEQLAGLLDGDLDVVVTAIDNLFEWTRAGADVKLVGQVEPTTPLSIHAASAITSLEDLEGHTFAVDAYSNGFALVARLLLREAGVHVEWSEVGGVAERLEALTSGSVTATLLGPPFTRRAVDEGFPELVSVQAEFPAFPGQGLIVRSRVIGTEPFDLFIDAMRRGGMTRANPSGLQVLTDIRDRLGLLPPDVALEELVA